jgi:hypothetical protein
MVPMSEGDGPVSYSAFICHAKPDAARAEEICATLEARGLRCWIAPRDIRAGREYADEILHGIESSRCLVLVLSDAANGSTFVKREVERAVSKRKPVFPVRVEDVMPSPGLELFVASTHWLDAFTGRLVDHIDRLAQDLADERALAEGTDISARIARRRRLPRWIGIGAACAGVVAAIIVGTVLSRRFDRSGQATAPTTARAVAVPTTVKVIDAFDAHARSLGIDPAALKTGDFRASIHPDRDIPGGHVLRISADEKIQKLLEPTEKKFTLPGASAAQSFFNWSTQLPLKPTPPRSGEVTIEFVSFAHGTGPRHTIGPFRIPLHEGPPVSATGAMLESMPENTRAEVAHRMTQAARSAAERTRQSMRNAVPKEPRDPEATLDALKAAFEPNAAKAVVAKRITLAPALEKELGLTSDVPPDNSMFAGVLDPRTVALMSDEKRKRRWVTAMAALSMQGLADYKLGDTPALVVLPRPAAPGGNLKGWASLREVRVGTSPGALSAVPVQVTLVDVRRGRVPISAYAIYIWLAELPGDAKQVFVQFVYVDGDTSKVLEAPIEDLVLK